MEVSDSDVVSQSAFSQQKMNEMSPITSERSPPALNSDKCTQMKAMLTSNGSIKIIISSSDESGGEENLREEVSNSDDSSVDAATVKSSKSASSKPSEVDTSTTFTSTRLQEDDDDDDELSQYKQSPRAVFLSTVCHVSVGIFE